MQAFALVQPGGDWHAGDAFIAGGTDLLQLMKNDVVAPTRLTDLEHLDLRRISIVDSDLHLGALTCLVLILFVLTLAVNIGAIGLVRLVERGAK